MEQVSITTQLTFDDYKKYNLYFLKQNFKLHGIIIMIIFGLIFLFNLIVSPRENLYGFIPMLIVPTILLFIYRRAIKKAFNNQSRLSEKTTYKIDKQCFYIEGESFETKLNWNKMDKVEETKDFFLVYQSKMAANIILKRDMTDDLIRQLRAVLVSISNLDVKLMND
jgi:hypothetical protein